MARGTWNENTNDNDSDLYLAMRFLKQLNWILVIIAVHFPRKKENYENKKNFKRNADSVFTFTYVEIQKRNISCT